MPDAIPVIDIGQYGTDSARSAAIATETDRACRETGFFLITGHDVPKSDTATLFSEARQFFRLPTEQKLKSRGPGGHIARGYTPFRGETLAAGTSPDTTHTPDLKEMLDFGPEPADGITPDNGFFAPDIWPEQPAGLKPAIQAYTRHMSTLATTLLRIFAETLNVPEHIFLNAHRRNISALRLICYPESDSPSPAPTRGGAHTDYGSLTILTADNATGGLQAKLRSGNWVDVIPQPGQFAINIGDIMPVWTNDRWVSTPHRVIAAPASDRARSRRHSIVFFHQPDPDAIIAPGDTPHYPPTTYGDHWRRKWLATRQQSAAP
ncbi:isopenicillin N synthase family dioxygenase [Acetobacter fallax]|uniref:2-oxoglutarate-dependent ethylene/succinate-forming enzyme n=1 Tax=Acetobacter fallax TaxID=1737473 RepID=A0ABX0K4Z3_9PROT|nr:isopenicillin N synthase family oxygenase [Acetobacter fallax]NHO31432.1 isopenicillin N synthase family oxygenase [Acetobacter fallax]NHO34984.1 isopenicillin N synthase family oxygenase [Acetobacter fallax]